jgi:hypothetical protein
LARKILQSFKTAQVSSTRIKKNLRNKNGVSKVAKKMSKHIFFDVMASQAQGLSYETPTAFVQ